MNSQHMGKLILKLRKEKGMTQKDLAAKLQITDNAVSKWERGMACPDISILFCRSCRKYWGSVWTSCCPTNLQSIGGKPLRS